MKDEKKILNAEQVHALAAMLNGGNYFLTGSGGTGKSVVIREFCKRSSKRLAVLAPTGLAALNLGDAATVHSFFEFSIGVADFPHDSMKLARRLNNVESIIVDEVSMLRSDVFSAMDMALRFYRENEAPFGGVQMILVGDFCQLPPVVDDENIRLYLEFQFHGEYAFCTPAWEWADFQKIELKTIMRQRDPRYIEILEAIRGDSADFAMAFNTVNTRVQKPAEEVMALCCTRSSAEQINFSRLELLNDYGVVFRGRITGNFPLDRLPTDFLLRIKKGERVMLLANHPSLIGYEYVNGDLGIVLDYNEATQTVMVHLKNKTVMVTPVQWSNFEYDFDLETRQLEQHEIGSFWQLPLVPAYATTIHKAQGQTLDQAHVVLGRNGCFVSGQLYTALSRVRSLENVTLDHAISVSDIIPNPQVVDFYQQKTGVSSL